MRKSGAWEECGEDHIQCSVYLEVSSLCFRRIKDVNVAVLPNGAAKLVPIASGKLSPSPGNSCWRWGAEKGWGRGRCRVKGRKRGRRGKGRATVAHIWRSQRRVGLALRTNSSKRRWWTAARTISTRTRTSTKSHLWRRWWKTRRVGTIRSGILVNPLFQHRIKDDRRVLVVREDSLIFCCKVKEEISTKKCIVFSLRLIMPKIELKRPPFFEGEFFDESGAEFSGPFFSCCLLPVWFCCWFGCCWRWWFWFW